jgi:hypothetical protein
MYVDEFLIFLCTLYCNSLKFLVEQYKKEKVCEWILSYTSYTENILIFYIVYNMLVQLCELIYSNACTVYIT